LADDPTRTVTLQPLPTPQILDRETAYAGYITVERVRVRLADGAEVMRDLESHGDAIAVLPYDATRKTALIVSLFRLPAFDRFGETALVEACAGMIENETAPDTARREAMEEMGVRLGEIDFVGRVWSSPGVSAERENEGITVLESPLPALAQDADDGKLVDLKLLALVQTLRVRRPDLFT
jgi:nudix-type nucleoside diphosphatase (YffH/AdpP family)